MSKQIIVLVFLFLHQILSYGQNNEIREFYQDGTLKHLQIYNKNKQLIQESRFDAYGRMYSKQVYFYLKDLIKEENHYDSKGIDFKIKKEYNKKQQLIKERWYNSKDSLNWFNTYKYDKLGNLIENFEFKSIDSIRYRQTYTYDENNNLIENCGFLSDGTKTSMTRYKYDSINKRVEERDYLENDKLNFISKFEYDKFNNKIRERIYYQNEIDLISELLYWHNSNRLLTKKEWYQQNKLIERTLYNYDSLGNLIDEKLENDFKILNQTKYNRDGLLISEYTFHKSLDFTELVKLFDSKGNRIEEREYENDCLEYKLIDVYDSVGKNIQSTKQWGDGRKSIWKYDYDKLGRIVKWTLHGDCNQLYTDAFFEYDSLENKISTRNNYQNGLLLATTTYFKDQIIKTLKYNKGILYYEEQFNLSGRITQDSFFEYGLIKSKTTYTYHENSVENIHYRYDNIGSLISKDVIYKKLND